MDDKGAPPGASDVWQETTVLFSNLRAMRPRRSWLTGLSVGTSPKRLDRLTQSRSAAQLMRRLLAMTPADFAVYRAYAHVNLDQAEAAMRLSLIANITIPVGFLVIVNQFFPGSIQQLLTIVGPAAMLGGVGCAAFLLVFLIWYSYAGVFQARDIVHLTAIAAARRDPETETPGKTGILDGGYSSASRERTEQPGETIEKLL